MYMLCSYAGSSYVERAGCGFALALAFRFRQSKAVLRAELVATQWHVRE